MKFKPLKTIFKGIKGAIIGTVGSAVALSTVSAPVLQAVGGGVDTLQAAAPDNLDKATLTLISAIVGFVFEALRNFIKNRGKLSQ